MADIGDATKVADLDPAIVAAAKARIGEMLETAVERSRISPEPLPVIAVGGGSILAPDRIGDLEVLRPENFAVANAVGAAIAQISGEVDRIFALEGRTRGRVPVAGRRGSARDRHRGGRERGIDARGDRARGRAACLSARQRHPHPRQGGWRDGGCQWLIDLYGRSLTIEDIEALEIGSGILGTGGGGNPYIGKLRAREILREGYEMRLASLETLDDDARIVPLGGIGAPLISFERIKEGREGLRCLRALEKHLDFQADAVGCEEIGGQNSMEPLIVAAMAGLPVVDGDGMGRAFPEMQMTTYSIYGHRSTPSVMCDLHGNVVVFEHAISEKWHETLARACVIAQGGSSVLAGAPMSGAFMKRYAIPTPTARRSGSAGRCSTPGACTRTRSRRSAGARAASTSFRARSPTSAPLQGRFQRRYRAARRACRMRRLDRRDRDPERVPDLQPRRRDGGLRARSRRRAGAGYRAAADHRNAALRPARRSACPAKPPST
jgi:hypothetical protein